MPIKGIVSIFSQIDYLIKPFQKENQRLYQALSLIAKLTDQLAENEFLVRQATFGIYEKFNLAGVRMDATDTTETRQRLYLPRDPGNNLVAQDLPNFRPRLNLQYVGISCRTPMAAGGPYIADILISRDQAVTWNSIFKSTNPLQLIVGQVSGSNAIFSIGTLFDGDLFRIDESGTDGTIEGVEIYLLGNLDVG